MGGAWLLAGDPVEPIKITADVRAKLKKVVIPSVDSTKIRDFETFVSELASRKAPANLVPAE